MQIQAVHHVAIATRDLERSLAFYSGVLGLTPTPRPTFPVEGAWLDLGTTLVRLVVHPDATFRTTGQMTTTTVTSHSGRRTSTQPSIT